MLFVCKGVDHPFCTPLRECPPALANLGVIVQKREILTCQKNRKSQRLPGRSVRQTRGAGRLAASHSEAAEMPVFDPFF